MIKYLLVAVIAVSLLFSSFVNAEAAFRQKRLLLIFEDNTTFEEQQEIIAITGVKVRKDFRPLLNAVSIIADESKIWSLGSVEKVKYIEEDLQVTGLHHSASAGGEYSNLGAWSVDHIHSSAAHQKGIKGDGVKVAILDTGIDYSHPDLAANYAGGYNFVLLTEDPFDDNGHGTFVSGIVAADDDGSGIIGVAPNSRIYALKVLDSNGMGYLSDIIAGLQWSVDNNVDVISMSFGLPSDSQSLRDAISNAHNAGILLVAAAGNVGSPDSQIDYPAAYQEVIAVGATDSGNRRASFSVTGADLELVAPGEGIVSTYPIGLGSYSTQDGTSAAAPHVAGLAALIKSSDESLWYPISDGNSRWSTDEITAVMHESAQDLGDTGRDQEYGYGLVDADKSVRVFSQPEQQPEPEVPNPDPPADTSISDTSGTFTIVHQGKLKLKKPAGEISSGRYEVTVELTGNYDLTATSSSRRASISMVGSDLSGTLTIGSSQFELDVEKFDVTRNHKTITYKAVINDTSDTVTGKLRFNKPIDFSSEDEQEALIKSTLKAKLTNQSISDRRTSGTLQLS